jgi:DNA end-binding protein Ku
VARAIWSGSISFGLLNVPVKMYSGVSDHRLHFRYIHEKDGSPIGYAKYCKAEDQPVSEEEIVKAFEYEGEMVPMRDEDFESAAAESSHRTIEVRDFVELAAIDPTYYERTYILEPNPGAEKPYALLVRAMEECGRAAIAKFVMRDRQNLACLRPREGVLLLERMHFADEVRDHGGHRPEVDEEPSKRELDIARSLIEELSGEFQPEQYADSYRDALCEIIEAKRQGETITPPDVSEPEPAPDLMAALEASLAEVRAGGGGKRRKANGDGGGSNGGGDLSELSKKELYERAKKADVSGRAEMSKDELAEALAGG